MSGVEEAVPEGQRLPSSGFSKQIPLEDASIYANVCEVFFIVLCTGVCILY